MEHLDDEERISSSDQDNVIGESLWMIAGVTQTRKKRK